MTFTKVFEIRGVDRVQSTLTVPVNLNVNTRIPCTHETISGITFSNGQMTIDAGKNVLLSAGAFISRGTIYNAGYLEYQWYNVTSSTWIGRSCTVGTNKWNYNTERFMNSAFARCVVIPSVQTTVELRIKNIHQVTNINETSDNGTNFEELYYPSPWYSVLAF